MGGQCFPFFYDNNEPFNCSSNSDFLAYLHMTNYSSTWLKLMFFALFSITYAQAQKPEKGTFTSEAQLNISSNFGSPIYSSGLNGRYFINKRWAITMGMEVSQYKYYREVYENKDGSGGMGNSTTNNINYLFNLGGRYFTKGTETLAPYIGVDCGIGIVENNQELKNMQSSSYAFNFHSTNNQKANQARISFLFGADYWIKGSFYFGANTGMSTNWVNYKRSVMTTNDNGFVTTTRLSPSSNFNISTLISSGIRVGWRFN
jgi:hypothetical protein